LIAYQNALDTSENKDSVK